MVFEIFQVLRGMILNVYSCSLLVMFTSFHSWIPTATTGRFLETVRDIRALEHQSFTVCHWRIPSSCHCRKSLTRITLDWWLVWQQEDSILCKMYLLCFLLLRFLKRFVFAWVFGLSVYLFCRKYLTHITLDLWLILHTKESILCKMDLCLKCLLGFFASVRPICWKYRMSTAKF